MGSWLKVLYHFTQESFVRLIDPCVGDHTSKGQFVYNKLLMHLGVLENSLYIHIVCFYPTWFLQQWSIGQDLSSHETFLSMFFQSNTCILIIQHTLQLLNLHLYSYTTFLPSLGTLNRRGQWASTVPWSQATRQGAHWTCWADARALSTHSVYCCCCCYLYSAQYDDIKLSLWNVQNTLHSILHF
jgi:hypothetical protein